MCCCVCCARKLRRTVARAMLCVKQLSSFSVRTVPVLRGCFDQSKRLLGLRLTRVTRSAPQTTGSRTIPRAEKSKRRFAPKIRVLLARPGLAEVQGFIGPLAGPPAKQRARKSRCHAAAPVLRRRPAPGRPLCVLSADISCWADPKPRCSTAAPRGGAPTRRRSEERPRRQPRLHDRSGPRPAPRPSTRPPGDDFSNAPGRRPPS